MKRWEWFAAAVAGAGVYGVLRASRQAAMRRMQQPASATAPRIVVLGGGFGGKTVHLARITSFRNKLATALDWTVGYLYDEDTARLEIEPSYRPEKAA